MRTRAFLEGRRRGQRPGQNSCQTGKIKSLVAINLKKSAFGLLLIFAFLYFLTTPRVAKKSLVGRRLQASGWISGRVRPGGGSTETQLARPQARNRLPRSLDSWIVRGPYSTHPFFFVRLDVLCGRVAGASGIGCLLYGHSRKRDAAPAVLGRLLRSTG